MVRKIDSALHSSKFCTESLISLIKDSVQNLVTSSLMDSTCQSTYLPAEACWISYSCTMGLSIPSVATKPDRVGLHEMAVTGHN